MAHPTPQATPVAAPARRGRLALCLALCSLVFAGCAWIRIHYTLHDPAFDPRDPTGLLKSDPGLLYYMTERLVDAGGAIPADFRSDPGPTWPERADLPAMFAVGQEFVIAWAWKLFGGAVPLHVFCVHVMSWIASLAVFAVFGLAFEWTRKAELALLAALMYAVLPFNYRTVGMILLREDLSFPLYALHLWLLARALRRGGLVHWLLAGCLLTLALATWHAMGFFLTIECAALWAAHLWSGRNPLAARASWALLPPLLLGGLTIPVLVAKSALASPAVLGLAALVLAPLLARRLPALARRARLASLATAVLLVGIAQALRAAGFGSQADYGHVTSFLWAKLAHFGQLPSDPAALPFDVRLLWQGPFVTSTWQDFTLGLGAAIPIALLALAWTVRQLWSGERGDLDRVDGLLLTLALISAWLVRRTMILPGLLLPALAVRLIELRPSFAARIALLVLVLGQAFWFLGAVGSTHQNWYDPPAYSQELRGLAEWADANLPHDQGVLGDFVSSTALLARSGIPIVLQPKYETADSRRRIERFYTAFSRGSLADLSALMREWKCRYLLVDRKYLWWGNRFIMGIPESEQVPRRGTPAWHFIHIDQQVLSNVPGFRLLYRSPPGRQGDYFRVYELLP